MGQEPGKEGYCPTCGQHHLAESDTAELHAMLDKCERLEREVLAENERLRAILSGVDEAAVERAAKALAEDDGKRQAHLSRAAFDVYRQKARLALRAAGGGQ